MGSVEGSRESFKQLLVRVSADYGHFEMESSSGKFLNKHGQEIFFIVQNIF